MVASASRQIADIPHIAAEYSNALTKLIHADESRGWEDLYKQGLFPAGFNQQWGGAPYGGLPDGTLGEISTSNIISNNSSNIGDQAARTYMSQGFKVSQNTDLDKVWIKLFKTGNPTNDLELYIYSDSAGSPDTVISAGTAIPQNGRTHSDNDVGDWVKFDFTVAPTLTAGTQYHIVTKSSGAVDAVNYWAWSLSTSGTYPHGYKNEGDATPAWTPQTEHDFVFIIQPVTKLLNTGGLFGEGQFNHFQGAPLNQSGAFVTSNANYLNHKRGSFVISGSTFTKGKTILDAGLAIDNNRIFLRVNSGTGFVQAYIYETNGSQHTVLGTTDISAGSHSIGLVYRSEGDGEDGVELFIDGVSEGAPITGDTIILNKEFSSKGHTILGGGFGTAPIWDHELDFNLIPSSDGYTWIGNATEANAFVVNGDKGYQVGSGYGSTQNGYYSRTTTFNNTVGWVSAIKIKVKKSNNSIGDNSLRWRIQDGTKTLTLDIFEYFIEVQETANYYIQIDMTTKSIDLLAVGKGSDFYVYADGRLIFDGTGLLDVATGTNEITFGDNDATAGDNSSAEWHYIKYYEGSYEPEYTNAEISEYAYWTEDRSQLMPTIYNNGYIQSVKSLAGMNDNYVKKVEHIISVKGITPNPQTTLTTFGPLDDMSLFSFNSDLSINAVGTFKNTVDTAEVDIISVIDGKSILSIGGNASGAGAKIPLSNNHFVKSHNGLHYINLSWKVGSGAGTANSTERELIVR